MSIRHLTTAEGECLENIPHSGYPRPQLKRKDWLCLNGEWEFETSRELAIPDAFSEKITVPFCPESLLSGINRCFPKGTVFCYCRTFTLPADYSGKRLLLHFGAVDQWCEVYLNGVKVCENQGGYLPFGVDITEKIKNDNTLVVLARDDIDHTLPWGKQRRDRGGMWYTPVSGIWQTVWLEPVPEKYITGLDIRQDGTAAQISVSGADEGTVLFEGKEIPFTGGTVVLKPDRPEQWSPESPKLYEFTVRSGEDEVSSYFALRTLSTGTVNGKKRLLLNGKPYFFHGLLDQGYWSDGIYTPAKPECFEKDILAMKSLGFNTLRKHIKIEPEQFYYDCDRLGMIVFQDMVNNGGYRYLRDTVIPTIGLQKRSDKFLNINRQARARFLDHMERTVRHLQNHPCICYWTVFNEGWGQFRADEAYSRLKAVDSSRFIDTTSGWFHQKLSDVDSLHIYFSELRLGKQDKPQVLSEFGGFSYKLPEHSANTEKTYGYRKYDDRTRFVDDLRELYLDHVVPLAENGLCAAIYTQVSDVEDETNGFFTYDRRALKVKPKELADIAEKLAAAVIK